MLFSTFDDVANYLSQLRGMFTREHKQDGTHADVTADSLTLQGAPVGEVVEVAFDADRFSGAAGGWAVTSSNFDYLRFTRFGQFVFLQFSLRGTVTTFVPEFLVINMPELNAYPTVTPAGSPEYQTGGTGEWWDGTNSRSGLISVSALVYDLSGEPKTGIWLQRHGDNAGATGFADWSNSSDLDVSGSILFMVNPNNERRPFYGA